MHDSAVMAESVVESLERARPAEVLGSLAQPMKPAALLSVVGEMPLLVVLVDLLDVV